MPDCFQSVSQQFLLILNAYLQVPSSAFSMCKVLQKKVSQFTAGLFSLNCCWSERTDFWQQFPLSLQVLILHGNDLRSLVPKGCCTGALATLKVRDIDWADNRLALLSSANISVCPFLRCWICMKISSHHFLMTSGSFCPCRYSIYLLYMNKADDVNCFLYDIWKPNTVLDADQYTYKMHYIMTDIYCCRGLHSFSKDWGYCIVLFFLSNKFFFSKDTNPFSKRQ